jgi:hypothetical protein
MTACREARGVPGTALTLAARTFRADLRWRF